MKTMIANMKKRKGFTLVEVIIVLVIIAILAAVLIPSLTGYIDKANQKVAVTNARNFTMAAQTVASEMYGTGGALTQTKVNSSTFIQDAFDLAELDNAGFCAKVSVSAKGKVWKVEFYDGSFKVDYADGKFTVTADPTANTTPDVVTVAEKP